MNQALKLMHKEFKTTKKTTHNEKRQTVFLTKEILAGKIISLSREINTIGKNQVEILEMEHTVSEIPTIYNRL